MANLPATTGGAGAMPRSRVVSYAMGDVANNVSFQMTSLFLMAYMTDIAGVPAAVAGTIYGVTKVWAGVTDLVAGNTVGRRETKWGRLRPWIVGVSPFLSISVVMLFSTPAGLSPIAVVAWILLFDAAFQLCYSFVNIPYGSLSAAMTENATDRSRLAGARAIASSVTGVLLAFVLAPRFQDTAADNIRLKFTIATILLSVVALVLYWICFKGTKEVVPRSPGKLTLSTTLRMVRKNKPLLVLCFGALFLLGGSFTMNAVMIYYAREVLGGARNFTWLYLAQTIGTIGIASMVPAITVKFGKRIGYVALASVAVVGFVLIAVVPPGGAAMPLALVAFLVYGVGFGGTNALMFSMQADTVDYGEWRTGTRAEGGSYSILSFVRKCGQGLGGFVGGAVIGAFGYVAGAQTQSAEAIQGIKVAAGWVPAGLCIMAALVLLFYPLGADQHRAIVAELHDRRAELALVEATSENAMVATRDGGLVAVRPVVTVNEQYGAGASYVAQRVAQRLRVPYIGTRFSSEELERAEDLESAPTVVYSDAISDFLRSFSRTPNDVDASISADAQIDTELVQRNIDEVIDAVKDSGGVIVGRDATIILARMQGAVHIRLEAPVAIRVARAVETLGIGADIAARRQQREDRVRSQMSRRLMHWDPTDKNRYDLVIDTSRVSLDEAVDLIIAASVAKRNG